MNKYKYFQLIILFSAFFIALSHYSFAEIISQDRRIDWSPGISSGIPTNYTLCANVKNAPYNAVGDGLTDDTAVFQNALAACASGTYVYVPSGTYKLTAGLNIPSGVLLKGDGPALSRLKDYQSGGAYLVQINGQSSTATVNIISGYAKDSTQITVDNATNLNVYDYIMISQLNEIGLAFDKGYGSTCTWCGPRDLNERTMAQIVKIIAKLGNDLTLSRPIYYATSGYSPQAMKLGSSVRINSGIQDLYLERVNTAGSGYNIVFMQFCVNCWVKNIETYKTGGAHIRMSYVYGSEIRDSYFHEAWGYGSGAGYGILMINTNSDNLIENNIFNLTRHSIAMEAGGSGNVIAYNYSKDPYDSNSPTWLSGDMITHGAHPYMNLFEGNYVANFENDNTWGSSSHNTYLRNYANRSRSIITTLAQRAIDVQANNHFMNFIGNVLGPIIGGGAEGPGTACGVQPIDWRAFGCNTPSGTENPPTDSTVAPTILRHGNYSYASGNTQWDSGITNHNLPESYYLLSKPSWWGSLIWPSIGPDVSGYVASIPAKERFLAGSTPPPVSNFSPNQIIEAESGQLTSMQTGISGSDTYIYTNANDTGSAKYTFDIPTSGQYKMEAKVNSNNDTAQNSFYIGLDSESAQGNNTYSYSLPLVGSFTWDEVNKVGNGTTLPEFDPMTWNLTQGTHSFTFYGREFNTWLDQIRLIPAITDTTAPTAPTGLAIE